MKNLHNTILIALLLMISITKAQKISLEPGANNLDPYADKFMGTWVWQSGNSSFTLILKKENALNPFLDNVRKDWVIGFHKFIDNGTVVEDTTDYKLTNFEFKKWSVLGGSKIDFPDILRGSIRHITKNKSVDFEIEYIDSTHIKLLSLENWEGIKIRFPGQPAFDWSITLPQNIILTKQ